MEKLTTYLCAKSCRAIEYVPYANIEAIEAVDGTVRTALWPEDPVPGCQPGAGKIIAHLSEMEGTKPSWSVNPLTCREGRNLLTWLRQAIMFDGNPVGLESYITIKLRNASDCRWVWSGLIAFGADGSAYGRLVFWVDVGSGSDPCPDDKEDVFGGGGISVYSMIQNQIVPGELMNLKWAFWDGQHREEITVDAGWFCTCCFTGGKVKAINGDYGDVAITYTVEIQGAEKSCVSSDFVEYEVGDWVFVLVPSSACAECGRTTACKEGCEESAKYIILPLKIGNYGP